MLYHNLPIVSSVQSSSKVSDYAISTKNLLMRSQDEAPFHSKIHNLVGRESHCYEKVWKF